MVAAAAATIVAFGLLVAYRLWSINDALSDAREQVSALDLENVAAEGGLRPALDPVLDNIERADRHADSLALSLLDPIPVIGDQVDGVRDVTDALASIVPVADASIDDIDAAIGDASRPGGKIGVVDAADDAVVDITTSITSIGTLSDDGLLPPLSGSVRQLNRKLDETEVTLADIRSDLATVRELLVGPTRLLLVAANNAEVRAGMGMHLSAGLITISDGEFETSTFYPTRELTDVTEGTATVPDELDELFGGIWGFGREWRTTSTTPNFPVVGDVLAQLSARTPFGSVDGVISVDAPALAHLLDAVGPVEVADLTVTSENAIEELLRNSYIRQDEVGRDERYELQSEVATAVFNAMTERPIDMVAFASALQRAANGRNLLAWSPDADVQALWKTLGADGSLTDTDLLVAFQNASASKRDYYIRPTVTIVPVATSSDDVRRFRVTAALTNPVVDPEPTYATTLSQHAPPDVHRTYVTFTLPGTATDVAVSGGYSTRIGTDGPTVMAATWMRVPVTETGAVVAEFSLPRDEPWVRLVPSARVEPTVYEFGPVTVTDEAYQPVLLPRVAAYDVAEPKWAHALATILAFIGLLFMVARGRRLAGTSPDPVGARTDGYLAAVMFVLSLTLVAAIAVS